MKLTFLIFIFLSSGWAQGETAEVKPVLAPNDPQVAACLNPPPAPKISETKKEAPVDITYEKVDPLTATQGTCGT